MFQPQQSQINVYLYNSYDQYKKASVNARSQLLAFVKEGVERYEEVLKDIKPEDYEAGIRGYSYREMAIKLAAGKQFINKVADKAYLKSNIWGNYYLLISRKKIKDWNGKPTNKPEIFDWIKENYPQHVIIDQTKY